ncbi:pitrilysin family protein [Kingella sp. (in: b-proteobacteria)]|uniref:M16 family metallopeptidase n=1 Tax=Kingella sp. (in: b-proteobacteria) TaxID=2020713 RepID=UPI0026DB8DCC|nr:pitrilysin family protein [Kingella sp. (in: b-proteobacteria)]MDO4656914.1 pitrilysin family protein [Kingella sp. (in: b-proteobacteria)]
MSPKILALALLATFPFAAHAALQASSPAPLTIASSTATQPAPSTATHERVLPNGLRVIVKEDHRAPVAMIMLWYKVGSSDEVAGKTGLSHALEHMMFKGTQAVPAGKYAEIISALGGNNNAYTTDEETVYHVKIAAEHLPKVLELEADRMANLNFSNSVFINEMKVIREERRQRIEDNPQGLLYEEVMQRAWQKSPNRTSVIGKMADLHKLTSNDLRQWYKKWYAPNNATLVIVGDVQPETAFAQAEQYFGSLKKRPLPARQNISEPLSRGKAVQSSIRGNTKQPLITIAYRVPHLTALGEKLPYALDMLTNVLDGHNAARLSKNLLRGKQIAQNIDTGYSLLARSPQLWGINASPAANVSTGSLKTAIEAEIADIAEHGISEEELNRARSIEHAKTIFARDSINACANLIGLLQIAGFSWRDEAEIRRRIQAVSAADIQAAAKLLTKDRQIYVELLPDEQAGGAKSKAK